MNKENNKIFVILSMTAVAILLLIFYLLLSVKSEQVIETKLDIPEDAGAATALEKNNQNAIKRAERMPSRTLRRIDETDHVLGAVGAVVEIIFYGDYDDEFTSAFNDTLEKARKEFDEKITIAFRHFPQRQHPNSYKMALSAECADAQGKFWEMHEELFSLKRNDDFSHENLMERVTGLGLDSEKFDKCVYDEEYKDRILSQISEADSFTIIGTPTSYVNDKILTGATPWEDFVDSAGFERKGLKSVIEEELN